jgi:hypothetical protein
VKHYWKSLLDSEAEPVDINYVVVFKNGSFQQTDVKNKSMDKGVNIWYEWNEVKVIGNIYQNPELLNS